MTTPGTQPQLTVTDITETRHGSTQHMHWPVDEETTRSLVLLTHARVPLRRRLLRWLTRRLNRVVVR